MGELGKAFDHGPLSKVFRRRISHVLSVYSVNLVGLPGVLPILV